MTTTAKTSIIDLELMRDPIHHTWSQIAFDCDFVKTNADAIELCVDADRMTFHASGKDAKARAVAAEKELDRAIKAHGYKKVASVLSRNVRLL